MSLRVSASDSGLGINTEGGFPSRKGKFPHGAALADGRGGITTAHGFSLADQVDGTTMTTWAHLTELFSSLPWFKMRDPRGVARNIHGVAVHVNGQ